MEQFTVRLSDFLDSIGHPVAYYPALAAPLGGINAAILFCQLYYWSKRATDDRGVFKTQAQLTAETGMSRNEQENARRSLKRCGVLHEKHDRLEHKMFYRLDLDRLEDLLKAAAAPDCEKPALPNAGKSHSRMRETNIRECEKPALPNAENQHSRMLETDIRERQFPAFVNGVKTTAEITEESSSNACARDPVDNSAAAAAADEKDSAPENRERELTDLLIALERDRGKVLAIDRSKDRAVVLTWVGKAVTAGQLRAAHKLAAAARVRDEDDRPTYVAFVAGFLAEACAPAAIAAVEDWWLAGEEVLVAAGEKFGARPKHRDEPLPLYRAVVARAAGKGPWIDAILRDAQRTGGQFLQTIVATLGEALMPVDWYAS
ncbi:hypothetical protein [Paraburkholderia caballeronis]|uniref:Helix-turn-helix domain-containing protein n=1 Tax=Paraburkholderia caballeronis TaxID=416943 RepID=A0A1H7L002_9BURK|nr:hypothetical protein [Paraburkholderia caballeronis]PXW28237.1 hypothetical protein C7403_102129 [Paraburkholderia caballeronis]PXX03603.1 hypothetical protein C7407_102129 [Paraburkholderia caballeronis]RAK04347.1 hypothetical protein C7409_102129 [Paraburkholderia caballeronis]SED83890.1 hypothetical protein SAMN05445871_4050 [Paraburkholderia caballeronis]SEK92361.1 hypothetical protein SAMN05192542_104129 [Paraburkholderia caballeronis]